PEELHLSGEYLVAPMPPSAPFPRRVVCYRLSSQGSTCSDTRPGRLIAVDAGSPRLLIRKPPGTLDPASDLVNLKEFVYEVGLSLRVDWKRSLPWINLWYCRHCDSHAVPL